MDLHLLDQVLKGRFKRDGPLLDAGCGEGKNLHYFIQNGFKIFITDLIPSSIQMAKMVARSLQAPFTEEHTFIGDIEDIPWEGFQSILLINVLQHTNGEQNARSILHKLFQILDPDGILFLKVEITCTNSDAWITRENLDTWIRKTGFHFVENIRFDEIGEQCWGIAVLGK